LLEEGNEVVVGDGVERGITSRKPCQPKEALKPIYHIFCGFSSISKAILLNFPENLKGECNITLALFFFPGISFAPSSEWPSQRISILIKSERRSAYGAIHAQKKPPPMRREAAVDGWRPAVPSAGPQKEEKRRLPGP
jgi:hypothetical protein